MKSWCEIISWISTILYALTLISSRNCYMIFWTAPELDKMIQIHIEFVSQQVHSIARTAVRPLQQGHGSAI